ncbi:unnamed protein product [Ixodes persulcatus]
MLLCTSDGTYSLRNDEGFDPGTFACVLCVPASAIMRRRSAGEASFICPNM